MSEPVKLEVHLQQSAGSPGNRILLGGVDITHSVNRIEISAVTGRPTTAIIYLVHIELDGDIEAATITPPPPDDSWEAKQAKLRRQMSPLARRVVDWANS